MLREIKYGGYYSTDLLCYNDEQGRLQSDHKCWWSNGQLKQHSLFKDGELHGELIKWDKYGTQTTQQFYKDGEDITDQVKALVEDINTITKEEQLIILFTFDIKCVK